MRTQHLDAHNITLGVLSMIRPHPDFFLNNAWSLYSCGGTKLGR